MRLTEARIAIDDALEFASVETVKQCVVAGMGVSLVPTVAAQTELAAGKLVQLPWRKRFDVYTQLVWSPRRSLGSAHTAFRRVARESFGPPDDRNRG